MLLDIQHSPSLFNNHSLQPQNFAPSLHITNSEYWISWLIIGCFSALVWMVATYRKKLNLVVSAAISNRNVEQLIRNEYALSNRLSVVLSILFLIVTTIFICQTNTHFNWVNATTTEPTTLFVRTFIYLLLFLTLKQTLVRIAGLIFEKQQESFWHIFNIFLFNEVLGIFAFPIVVLIQYSSPGVGIFLSYLIIGLFGLSYLYKFARLLFSGGSKKGISQIHLFLYLCTLEILPLVVVIKLFVSRI
jgi:hypothetical protein